MYPSMAAIPSPLNIVRRRLASILRIGHTFPVKLGKRQTGATLERDQLSKTTVCVVPGKAAFTFWWWNTRPRVKELEASWESRVVVLAGAGVHAHFDNPSGRYRTQPRWNNLRQASGIEAPRVRSILPDRRCIDVAGGRRLPRQTRRILRARSGQSRAWPCRPTALSTWPTLRTTRSAHRPRWASDDARRRDGLSRATTTTSRTNVPVDGSLDCHHRSDGRMIVADTSVGQIRQIELDGTVATLTLRSSEPPPQGSLWMRTNPV